MSSFYDIVYVCRKLSALVLGLCGCMMVIAFYSGWSITRLEASQHLMNTARDMGVKLQRDNSMTSHPVLLVAYLRSGSSWLGDIIQQANGSFYVFEPLKYFIKEGYYTPGAICFNNNTCRDPRTSSERDLFALQVLEQVFSCNLDQLHPDAVKVLRESDKSEHHRRLRECEKNTLDFFKCFDDFNIACQASTLRIVKTIRLSMKLVVNLVKLYPHLKIIHLVRDPRGISNSRRNRMFKLSLDTKPHSRNLCSRMLDDVRVLASLESRFPHRSRTVFYEAMTENPTAAAKYIYKFLNIKIPATFQQWMENHTSGTDVMYDEFGTFRHDSKERASKWRTEMNYATVQKIDVECRDVYDILGYLPLTNPDQLTDFHFMTRRKPNIAGFT